MNTAKNLEEQLMKIHKRSYPAYKDLKGSYQFPGFILHIDHVQGDPFAAPSKVRVEVLNTEAGFPNALYKPNYQRVALQDYLNRIFKKNIDQYMFKAKGSGKSGLISISRCGQTVLECSAVTITEGKIMVRFEVGFPANGRSINAIELKKILFTFIPSCVQQALYYRNLDSKKIEAVVNLAHDQYTIRQELKKLNLVAFVANGAILPRESGVSDKPMKQAVTFESPKSMEVELTLPHYGKIKGMGIRRGVTLIVGGGYHGKSTLLKALELGVYNHIAGDGREYVISDESAMKIRAEDGRCVSKVDISMFINHLPNKKDTISFSTEDASGSTSQAANVVEALASGAKTLLIDEDTSATNFMVRDDLMQAVIVKEQEPITPFIEQARRIYEEYGVSIILVAGSSGSYFYISDTIIQMDTYKAYDITKKVKLICGNTPASFMNAEHGVNKTVHEYQAKKRYLKPSHIDKKHGQIKIKQFGKDSFVIGKDNVDLKYVEQIIDSEQTTSLGYILKYIVEKLERDTTSDIHQLVEDIYCKIEKEGLQVITNSLVSLAQVRKQEIYACVNRYRGFNQHFCLQHKNNDIKYHQKK